MAFPAPREVDRVLYGVKIEYFDRDLWNRFPAPLEVDR